MAAEVMKLRQELAMKPSKAIQVIDHGHTFYVTNEVQHVTYPNRFRDSVVPETEGQPGDGEEPEA